MNNQQHLDEAGQPCTRHPQPTGTNLMALALLGSRMPSFHHDVASKLQALMMAVDELSELAETPETQAAASSAVNALRDLTTLFATNRALAKAPQRKPTPIGELFARAAERSGVKTTGELPSCSVDVEVATIAHACAVLLDLCAGPLTMGRTVAITGTLENHHVRVRLAGPAGVPLPNNGGDMLALATFAIGREQGELRCGEDRYLITLPLTS